MSKSTAVRKEGKGKGKEDEDEENEKVFYSRFTHLLIRQLPIIQNILFEVLPASTTPNSIMLSLPFSPPGKTLKEGSVTRARRLSLDGTLARGYLPAERCGR